MRQHRGSQRPGQEGVEPSNGTGAGADEVAPNHVDDSANQADGERRYLRCEHRAWPPGLCADEGVGSRLLGLGNLLPRMLSFYPGKARKEAPYVRHLRSAFREYYTSLDYLLNYQVRTRPHRRVPHVAPLYVVNRAFRAIRWVCCAWNTSYSPSTQWLSPR